jgi:RNA polymerase sigma-70 factor (ECF subfamily)
LEFAAEDEELIADLERAEDSAVIRLALAKLNPRQREALVASVYEEKTTEEVAGQLGLSENATRQLLFRARSSFKKALVGEVEIQGKSLSQVLTIAAKKAAYDAKENAAKVGAFIVLV